MLKEFIQSCGEVFEVLAHHHRPSLQYLTDYKTRGTKQIVHAAMYGYGKKFYAGYETQQQTKRGLLPALQLEIANASITEFRIAITDDPRYAAILILKRITNEFFILRYQGDSNAKS